MQGGTLIYERLACDTKAKHAMPRVTSLAREALQQRAGVREGAQVRKSHLL